MEKDAFAARARGLEEEYFRRREAALLEKIRTKAAEEAERRAMGAYHGVTDEEILSGFAELGYDRDTVQVLHLVPIIQVAWSDGEVSAAERDEILKIAAARNVAPGSPAHAKLLEWLGSRPPQEFFERTLGLISDLLEALPQESRTKLQYDVMGAAQAVALASGGFLGLGNKVSGDEQTLLDRFRAEFERAHRAALEKAKKG